MLSSAALWLSARLPQQCLACHTWAQGGPLCAACWATFAPHGPSAPPRCTGCGLALPQGYSGPRCGACLRQPPPWQACHVWVDYAYPWADLLTRWKLHQQPALARPIAHWLGADPAIAAAVAVGLMIEAVEHRRRHPELLLVPANEKLPADEKQHVRDGDVVPVREERHP